MLRKQRFTADEFKEIYSKVPRLTVDLVIVDDRGILLTLRRENGWEGQWHLPGGTVYLGESLTDTVDRIALEELGTKVIIEKKLGHIEYSSEKKERGFGYSVAIVFLCSLSGREVLIDDQAEKFSFFIELPENTISEQKTFMEGILSL